MSHAKLLANTQNGRANLATGRARRRDGVALHMSQQCSAHRALVGNLALVNIALGAAHDGEDTLAAAQSRVTVEPM